MDEQLEKIRMNKRYKKCYRKIEACEKNRVFCHHDMNHFLDVARIAWILNLQENLQIDKNIIYAAAILHDIGRHKQYKKGIPHEIASAQIAEKILNECGYENDKIQWITEAIRNHRDSRMLSEANLGGILYRADKMSRACFSCKAEKKCNWAKEKKNLSILY